MNNGIRENRMIEFKRELPGSSDEDKKEFLADATSFANTDGGVLAYGVETARDENKNDTGVAAGLPGVELPNLDKERQRLLSLLKDAVSPALNNRAEFQEVLPVGQGRPVLLLGIEASLDRPHMVKFKGQTRFYRRSEAGKYEPDISELRRMFLESSSWIQECEAFRDRRLELISQSGVIDRSSQAVIHVLPLARLGNLVDLRGKLLDIVRRLPPLNAQSYDHRYNADGAITFSVITAGRAGSDSYTQVFRFGGVEGYTSRYVREHPQGGRIFWIDGFTDHVVRYVSNAMSALRDLFDVEPPYCILVSLRGIHGVTVPDGTGFRTRSVIDVDTLLLPPVVMEAGADVKESCRPLLDIVWQAAGYEGQPTQPRRLL